MQYCQAEYKSAKTNFSSIVSTNLALYNLKKDNLPNIDIKKIIALNVTPIIPYLCACLFQSREHIKMPERLSE